MMAIGLTSLLLTVFNINPAQAFFHGGGGSWSASGFRGTASGGMVLGVPVVIVAALHQGEMVPGVAQAFGAVQLLAVMVPGVVRVIVAALHREVMVLGVQRGLWRNCLRRC
ncbi:hypothetical protein NON20_25470 (plasmid) [Synechocystis sp. B12]|nr:hypothetical protein NON20_25470 [Synechocystis sp. B12]